jgi:uncharacterized membrane protein
MAFQLTSTGAFHAALALGCILIGLLQFVTVKGTRVHRALGYGYVYAMLVVDCSALLVYQFTGRFNLLHALAIMNLACIVLAIVPMLRNPRPPGWKILHYYWMSWSYVGLLAAAGTQLVVHSVHLVTKAQVWMVITAISILVTMAAYVVIGRNRPAAGPPTAAGGATIQHDGAPS